MKKALIGISLIWIIIIGSAWQSEAQEVKATATYELIGCEDSMEDVIEVAKAHVEYNDLETTDLEYAKAGGEYGVLEPISTGLNSVGVLDLAKVYEAAQ